MSPAKTRTSTSPDKLAPYRAKRDFGKTGEPAGSAAPAPSRASRTSKKVKELPRFVVQRHRASRLHYDFRLEIDGVLVSWAVPKGPTLDPKVRRAAFHVEDHPLEYFDFEGVIPAGEYGGGRRHRVGRRHLGAARDEPTRSRAVAAGELHLDLYGEKLRGRFVLVRTGTEPSGKEEWLLLHKHDEYASRRLGRRGFSAVGDHAAHQRRGEGRPGSAVALGPAGGRAVGRAEGRAAAGSERRRAGRARPRFRQPARWSSSDATCG